MIVYVDQEADLNNTASGSENQAIDRTESIWMCFVIMVDCLPVVSVALVLM